MAEITYLPEVRCEALPGGLLPEGVTARVRELGGKTQYVQVNRGMINRHGEADYLPIGIVEIDRRNRRVLIELPTQADSGINRMWVGFDDLRREVVQDTGAVPR